MGLVVLAALVGRSGCCCGGREVGDCKEGLRPCPPPGVAPRVPGAADPVLILFADLVRCGGGGRADDDDDEPVTEEKRGWELEGRSVEDDGADGITRRPTAFELDRTDVGDRSGAPGGPTCAIAPRAARLLVVDGGAPPV